MAQVEVTEVVLDYVNTEVRKVKTETTEQMNTDRTNTEDRFMKLIREELTHDDGIFGKTEVVEAIQAEAEAAKAELAAQK